MQLSSTQTEVKDLKNSIELLKKEISKYEDSKRNAQLPSSKIVGKQSLDSSLDDNSTPVENAGTNPANLTKEDYK